MQKFLFLFAFLASTAFGAERVIINPDSNGDLKIKVNVGGTVTDALTVTGSTAAATIGPASGSNITHLFQGGGRATLKINGVTAASGSALTLQRGGADSATIFSVGANDQSITGSVAGDIAFTAVSGNLVFSGDNGTLHGKMSNAGLWTLGPSGGLLNHKVNGALSSRSLSGIWGDGTQGGGGSTCNTECANDDSTLGFNSASGACLAAWTSAKAPSTCGTTLVTGICLCMGAN